MSEKSTTGQPCVMQPRDMMSTCGEKYMAKLSGVTPPLASIRRAGNSSFSVRAAMWSSCRREAGYIIYMLLSCGCSLSDREGLETALPEFESCPA